MKLQSARFSVGQIIQHKLFDYRGVVVDVDPCFMGTEEWYQAMARTRPPREAPWYKVLVHDATHETYVAERNLLDDESKTPVRHPLVEEYFGEFRDGYYIPHLPAN